MATVFIGFGSNMGDRKRNIKRALEKLNAMEGCTVDKISPLYSTEPVDYEDQDWFVNGAARLTIDFSPGEFLGILKSLEKEAGRTSGGPRFGPRVLDLDILIHGECVMESRELVIPHPRLHKRRFVLTPLCDIAPELEHPVLKRKIQELLDNLDDGEKKVNLCG